MEKRVEAVITRKQKINHDCYVFSYQFTGEKIQFSIGQFFRIIKTLPTYDHPEGEELFRKYTPINPCSQTVHTHSDRTLSIFSSKFTDPTAIPIFPMEASIPLSLRLRTWEISSPLRVLLDALAIKLEEWSLLVHELR